MNLRTLFSAAALSVATLVPTLSHASATGPSDCVLREHRVVSVEPYQIEQQYGRFISPQLRGAQIYVQAEPGLTAQWLQLTLEQHLGQMKGGSAAMTDCAVDGNVRVEVTPAGSGYWVRLIAPDSKSGEEVLRRARLLVG
jgi:hypothetical protein